MIRKMKGIKKEWEYPVLESDRDMAVTDKDKVEMLVIYRFMELGTQLRREVEGEK